MSQSDIKLTLHDIKNSADQKYVINRSKLRPNTRKLKAQLENIWQRRKEEGKKMQTRFAILKLQKKER